jgi:asparagine synthase (glutamine-hydrolysing)
VDSTIIATLAKEQTSDRLRTFSIGFEDQNYDESTQARQVAASLNSRHTEEIFSEERPLKGARSGSHSYGRTMADQSILPTYLLAQLAAGSVKCGFKRRWRRRTLGRI